MVCRLLALAGLGFVPGCGGGGGEDPPEEEQPPAATATVVHVHDPTATSWDGQAEFWNHVSQPAVDRMVDEGIMALTGASSVMAAWQTILPAYRVGEGIAIKVNLNNASSCTATGAAVDAVIEPVNAVVRGLTAMGVAESDIWIFDALRAIPDRFSTAAQYPGVRYFSADVCGHEAATFVSNDPDAFVTFSPPAGLAAPPPIRVSDVVVDATYLINMPLLKAHQIAGVTLGFKNHFGTIDNPAALHQYIGPNAARFRTDYSTMVDIYRNPHIADKTVLTIGDGLLGSLSSCCSAPMRWSTFGDRTPNSLFFSIDPVAIECVMCDFLAAEMTIDPDAAAFLDLASAAGLGTAEHGDPWGAGYRAIDYVRRDL